jgi:hypothetical protein
MLLRVMRHGAAALRVAPIDPYDNGRRMAMTLRCRDSDPIPKVPRAGEVIEHNSRRVQVMHEGTLVETGGYHGDWMEQTIRGLKGHHEPQEELLFDQNGRR